MTLRTAPSPVLFVLLLAILAAGLTEAFSAAAPAAPVTARVLASDVRASAWLPEAVVAAEAPFGTPVELPEIVIVAEAPYGTPVELPEIVVVAPRWTEGVLVAAGR